LFPAYLRVRRSIRFLLIAASGSRNVGADIKRTVFVFATIKRAEQITGRRSSTQPL
jgi:hypothetical protein